jgi:hypothetical protein
MGAWTLESVTGETSDFTTSQLFGTNVKVAFRLRYRPGTIGAFQETPRLDWHEKFIMKEHHNGQWWEFESSMYEHNPCSNTLKIWAGRYVHAYKAAMGTPDSMTKGSSTLLSETGVAVPRTELKLGLTDGNAQAENVRSYLKKNGGILEIKIHDIPSINIPTGGEHKERLLKFNCGVVSGGPRWCGEQYLDVNAALPQSSWTRSCTPAYTGFTTAGLTRTAPPASVSMIRPPTFLNGECW